MSVNEALDAFLALQRERLSESTAGRYEHVLELLRACMDGYGHQWLSEEEHDFFDREYERDEEAGSFCNVFGPDKILESLDDFVGWFLTRKTMASRSVLEAAPSVVRKLVGWLIEEGYAAPGAADGSNELVDQARSLAKADEFSTLLFELIPEGPLDLSENQDWENEMAVITHVDDATIWLRNEETQYEVPLDVPPEVAAIARPGWQISALNLGRTASGWRVLEMGNVYPGP